MLLLFTIFPYQVMYGFTLDIEKIIIHEVKLLLYLHLYHLYINHIN